MGEKMKKTGNEYEWNNELIYRIYNILWYFVRKEINVLWIYY